MKKEVKKNNKKTTKKTSSNKKDNYTDLDYKIDNSIRILSVILFIIAVIWLGLNIILNYRINLLFGEDFVNEIKNSEVIKNNIGEIVDARIPLFSRYSIVNNEICINYTLKTINSTKDVCVLYDKDRIGKDNKIYFLGYYDKEKIYYDLPKFKLSDYENEINENGYSYFKKINFTSVREFIADCSEIFPNNYGAYDSLIFEDKASSAYLIKEKKYNPNSIVVNTAYLIIKDNEVIAMWEE